MPLTTRLRKARLEEAAEVGSLIRDTIRACYTGVYPPRAVEFFLAYHSTASIEERTGRGLVLVAERNGELVATGALVGTEISGVFVKMGLHRQGIGTCVIDGLEALALRAGIEEVTLSISLPSLGFYERRGYEVIKAAEIDVGMGQSLKYWTGRKMLGKRDGRTPLKAFESQGGRRA